jgi:heat shock protein HtpX
MRRYRRDAGLSLRIALSLVGLCLVYVPFAFWVLGWVWFAGGLRAVAALAAIVVFLVLTRPLWIGRFGLLSVGRAPNPEEAQLLQPVVERLCGLADLPVPRVEVLDSELPNAFTVARALGPNTIVVTTGLLARLETDELEAVVAHELAHVANRDAFVMVIVSFPARVLRAFALGFGRLTRRNPLVWVMLVYLVPFFVGAWCAAALTTLLLMTFSRYRELVADRGAALLTGRPETVMSALEKISAGVAEIPAEDLRTAARFNPFYVVPASGPGGGAGLDPFVLFPTHPTLAQRLDRLAALARTQGSATKEDAAPLVVAEPAREPNPRATAAFCLAFVTWPLGWALPVLLDDEFGYAVYAEGFAMLTGFTAFVFALQALGRAQRGAGGGRLAALSLVILGAPLIFTFVGFAVVAVAGA